MRGLFHQNELQFLQIAPERNVFCQRWHATYDRRRARTMQALRKDERARHRVPDPRFAMTHLPHSDCAITRVAPVHAPTSAETRQATRLMGRDRNGPSRADTPRIFGTRNPMTR
ncbi:MULTISPECIES: hypothetical protein [Xanthomonas]|uniref:hypothetical protein n=1 Tax=Xanthomonas TaxID=338 RepID=UPI001ADAF0EB|nr:MULTISPECIES: hypothetical protein [unclassified Xanthomonas]MBO9874253.1 hypothetical protein [Xanthomonas sp. D-93]WNH46628.1 hypothetical protein PG878_09355 [Xanthomonas sp. A6251]